MSDTVLPSSDAELRPLVERAIGALYEVDCEIGRGGMGIVYRAKDRKLKRIVAIKVLPPELGYRSDIKSRFLREAETAAQLNHPNIVDIYSVDEAGQLVYFVMAYILGENLAKRLHDVGPLAIDEVRRILRDVADALSYAHERGVIHRDIKPDNILIDGESGRPMVTDFGIARAMGDGSSRLTVTGQVVGTPEYMSPEQAGGDPKIDGRSDLYSLGVVAYQMLAGEPPFTGNSGPAILVKHLQSQPTPIQERRPETPPELARIVMTLLEKDPAARLPSAAALVAALDSGTMGVARGGARPSVNTMAAPAVQYAPPVPRPSYGPGVGAAEFAAGDYTPAPEEFARWQAPAVQTFRKQMKVYGYVNGAILLLKIVGPNFIWVTGVWTVLIVVRYAKLEIAGYDWRDVFQQPRDRDLWDVAEQAIDMFRMLVNPRARARWREERRVRKAVHRSGPARLPAGAPSQDDASAQAAGAHGDDVRRAFSDRDEILRILARLSPARRAEVPDVERSARILADKVRALALLLANLERTSGADSGIQEEINRLEADANPLDQAASDTRVRRLAYLRRELRKSGTGADRRKSILAKLGDCAVSLESMKIDLLRLSAGADTPQHVTSLALEAMALAESVDGALEAARVAETLNQASGEGTRPRARPTV